MQSAVQLYGLAPPNNMGDADINITLVTGSADPSVNVYCNPMYGQYRLDNATRPSNYPQPGFAIWQSSKLCSLIRTMRAPAWVTCPTGNDLLCERASAEGLFVYWSWTLLCLSSCFQRLLQLALLMSSSLHLASCLFKRWSFTVALPCWSHKRFIMRGISMQRLSCTHTVWMIAWRPASSLITPLLGPV